MVSKASEDFPDPDNPVSTMSLSRGRSRLMLRRLCSRAPRITRRSDTKPEPIRGRSPSGGTLVRLSARLECRDGPPLRRFRLVSCAEQAVEFVELLRRIAGHERDRSNAEVMQSLRVLRQPVGGHGEPPGPVDERKGEAAQTAIR